MKKILFLMIGCLTLMSCGPNKGKLQNVALDNLELSLDNPKQLKVIAISEPDSAFGTGYFSQKEVQWMMGKMKLVTDTIMKRTGNMSHFDPNDRYLLSLAERQMRSMSEIRCFTASRRRASSQDGRYV